MVPLFFLEEGEQGEIIEISEGSHCHNSNDLGSRHCKRHRKFSDLGIRVGKKVKLLQKNGKGPLLIRVEDSKLAIGRGMAASIKVSNLQ